ncbi:hypothetical protein HAX54_026808 [Datura stramonium]|uniref:Uncharacterized protein n=1 Tax=Datura stramonium TaxID=4076 RepID=A0ABS8S865_DATST|nr:hypothetical protein [Datura stramonium]
MEKELGFGYLKEPRGSGLARCAGHRTGKAPHRASGLTAWPAHHTAGRAEEGKGELSKLDGGVDRPSGLAAAKPDRYRGLAVARILSLQRYDSRK